VTRSVPALMLLASLLLTGGAFAADPPEAPGADVRDRVERLEQGLAALRQEVAELRALVAPLVADGSDAAALPEPAARALAETTARIEQEQRRLEEEARTTADRVDLLSEAEGQRNHLTVYGTFNTLGETPRGDGPILDAEAFELVVSGQPHERLGFFAEVEFERAASVGGERGGEVLLEQAYANYSVAPWLNLRAGALLVPFGNVNVDHYAPNRAVISKPLTSFVIAPSDWTDNGFGSYGRALVGDLWSFDYELYAISGLDADITALGTRAARQPFGEDNNATPSIVGRAAWNLGGWLETGFSIYDGPYDDGGDLDLTGGAIDLFVERGPLTFTGEVNHLWAEQPAGPDAELEGWYGRLVYGWRPGFLSRGWHGRVFPTARIELVGQYDWARLDGPLDGVRSIQRERRWTGGINYRPSHHWVFKLDYEDSNTLDRALQLGDLRRWLASVGFQF